MSNVYLTLVSDVTSDYASNVANKFKVKPGLRLFGDGWKVSIHSAVLPKMAMFKELQSSTDALIALKGQAEKAGASDVWVSGKLYGSDLLEIEKSETSTTAEDFFSQVIDRIDRNAHAALLTGYKFSQDRARLVWDKTRVQPELSIASSNRRNVLLIHKTFAKAMRWSNTDDGGTISMGPYMVPDYPSYTSGSSSLGRGRTFSLVANKWLELNGLTDWRFINLHQSFNDALNLHPRPLTVTAKVTANTDTVTQSLGQVYYAPQGRERYLFTPPVEEWYDVQTAHWEEIEISLKELDGNLVNFQSDSQCLIRLHFKKD